MHGFDEEKKIGLGERRIGAYYKPFFVWEGARRLAYPIASRHACRDTTEDNNNHPSEPTLLELPILLFGLKEKASTGEE